MQPLNPGYSSIEDELIDIVLNHYQTVVGKATPLLAIKQYYGLNNLKFTIFGLGKFNQWLKKHELIFSYVRNQQKTNQSEVSEAVLVKIVKEFFEVHTSYEARKQVLNHIRSIYGHGSFTQFGYGTFPEFVARNNISFYD